MRRLVAGFTLAVFSLLLLCSPVHAAIWTANATTLDLIGGPAMYSAFLAPDGSRIAYFSSKELCLYSLAGEKGDCTDLPDDIGLDLESVRWSPDSTKLAFSENFIVTFRDSDIWLFDTETNTVKDLTPMPNRELKLLPNNNSPDAVFTVDMIPQWSADSQSIYFIRYAFKELGEAHALFYKVNIADETTQEVARANTLFALSTYGFAVSPDDSQIAYLLDTHGTEKDGTWLLDVATGKAKFAAAPVQETAPWAYQYSPDGSLLLSIGVDMTGAIGTRKPENSPIYTLPVSGGRRQQLNNDTYVYAAGWGHEGSNLAYTTFDQLNPDKEGLYITSAPGQAGEMVLPGRFIAPVPRSRTPIIWAANDSLLLSQAPGFKLVVVQLSQS